MLHCIEKIHIFTLSNNKETGRQPENTAKKMKTLQELREAVANKSSQIFTNHHNYH
jgi:hypothetical protein